MAFQLEIPSLKNGWNVLVQHIADLTGLRVETVFHSVKTLEKEGSIELIGHKIYR